MKLLGKTNFLEKNNKNNEKSIMENLRDKKNSIIQIGSQNLSQINSYLDNNSKGIRIDSKFQKKYVNIENNLKRNFVSTEQMKEENSFDYNKKYLNDLEKISSFKYEKENIKKEFLPYGVVNLDDHLEIFQKFQKNTLRIFSNNEANFSPIKPSSPKEAYDKILNSPRRQMDSILNSPIQLNSPHYIPYSPHRINSPVRAYSIYDDKELNLDYYAFSPLRNVKQDYDDTFPKFSL